MRGIIDFLRDAWWLARPYFASEERWPARLLLAGVVALNLGIVGLDVVLSYWNRAFYDSLQDKDWDSFIRLMLIWRDGEAGFMPGYALIAVIYITAAVYRRYLEQWMQIRWRRWMTERLLRGYFADRAYYRIALQGGESAGDPPPGEEFATEVTARSALITGVTAPSALVTDNPDQRIAEDVKQFVDDALTLSLELLSNIVTLGSFVFILWELSGPLTLWGITVPGYMVFVALIYAGLGTGLTHLVGRPLAGLNFRQQRVEADFRFALSRLRENAEGVALQGGEAVEHRGLAARFESLATNWWAIMQRTKLLNALVVGYGQVATVFPVVVAAPRYFSGALPLGGLTQTAGAFGQVQSALSWFVTSYAALARWRATVGRLAEFQRAVAAASAQAREGLVLARGMDGYVLDGVRIALPNGQALLEATTLRLPAGRSVVLTGRSGSGKSTLFRALAGIWPFASGRLERPSGRVLFLPQRPYLPLGTLRQALAYPEPPESFTADAIRLALDRAGLGHLAARLDEEAGWAQLLSGGELQRLALVRALLVKPDWLFLDEATASLDPESEARFYETLRRELPGTTILSIAHRPAVAGYHDDHLRFDRPDEAAGRLIKSAA